MKKTERTNKTRTAKGHILALIDTLQAGESFLTTEVPSEVKSYAGKYGKKVKTAIIYQVDPKNLETVKITKVTIQ